MEAMKGEVERREGGAKRDEEEEGERGGKELKVALCRGNLTGFVYGQHRSFRQRMKAFAQ